MSAFAPAEKSLYGAWPNVAAPGALRGAAAILAAVLAVAALLVAERRFAGALVAPLGALWLSLTSAVAVLLAAGSRFAWRAGAEDRSEKRESAGSTWLAPTHATNGAMRWLPAAAIIVLGMSLWLPGTSRAAIACFWSIAIVEEAWSLLPRRRSGAEANGPSASRPGEKIELHLQPAAPLEFSGVVAEAALDDSEVIDEESLEEEAETREQPQSPPSGHGKLAGPHYEPPRPAPAGNLCDPPHPEPAAPHFGLTNKTSDAGAPADERVVQQLRRSTTRDGVDVLRGSLCATFPPGLRSLSVHVAFCPAFVERPRMEFRQTSGPAARVKLAQLLSFGARFDIKLAALSQVDETVVLEISAMHP